MREQIRLKLQEYDRVLLAAIEHTMWRFGIKPCAVGFDSDDGSCTAVYAYPVEPEVMHPLDDIVVLL
jgi:hypothetical protein